MAITTVSQAIEFLEKSLEEKKFIDAAGEEMDGALAMSSLIDEMGFENWEGVFSQMAEGKLSPQQYVDELFPVIDQMERACLRRKLNKVFLTQSAPAPVEEKKEKEPEPPPPAEDDPDLFFQFEGLSIPKQFRKDLRQVIREFEIDHQTQTVLINVERGDFSRELEQMTHSMQSSISAHAP